MVDTNDNMILDLVKEILAGMNVEYRESYDGDCKQISVGDIHPSIIYAKDGTILFISCETFEYAELKLGDVCDPKEKLEGLLDLIKQACRLAREAEVQWRPQIEWLERMSKI